MARLTAKEKKVYEQVKERDNGLCIFPTSFGPCGMLAWYPPHHVVFKSQGGPTVPENLASLCRYHHDTAHGKINGYPMTQEEIREALQEIVKEE